MEFLIIMLAACVGALAWLFVHAAKVSNED